MASLEDAYAERVAKVGGLAAVQVHIDILYRNGWVVEYADPSAVMGAKGWRLRHAASRMIKGMGGASALDAVLKDMESP